MTHETAPLRRSRYGRCDGCGQLKHVAPDGVLYDHNRYRVHGTSVAVVRCTGSGARPVEQAG